MIELKQNRINLSRFRVKISSMFLKYVYDIVLLTEFYELTFYNKGIVKEAYEENAPELTINEINEWKEYENSRIISTEELMKLSIEEVKKKFKRPSPETLIKLITVGKVTLGTERYIEFINNSTLINLFSYIEIFIKEYLFELFLFDSSYLEDGKIMKFNELKNINDIDYLKSIMVKKQINSIGTSYNNINEFFNKNLEFSLNDIEHFDKFHKAKGYRNSVVHDYNNEKQYTFEEIAGCKITDEEKSYKYISSLILNSIGFLEGINTKVEKKIGIEI